MGVQRRLGCRPPPSSAAAERLPQRRADRRQGSPVRAQGEAIARNLREMFGLRVPIISVVIGEGGSGGALAIGCANYNLIMEHSVYYVASPEACAAILWKSRSKVSAVRGPRARRAGVACSQAPGRAPAWQPPPPVGVRVHVGSRAV